MNYVCSHTFNKMEMYNAQHPTNFSKDGLSKLQSGVVRVGPFLQSVIVGLLWMITVVIED